MQVKLLHGLVEEMAGEGTGRIVEILFKKKDVNEFLIAKKMELTINQVRNILYKLSADNLVSFIRKKDKRKGWYIYFWTLDTEKCLAKLEGSLINKIENLNKKLESRETERFYFCESCDIEVSEEKALEDGFSCDECADIYILSDNAKPIRDVKTQTTKVRKNLVLIQKELEAIRKRLEITRKRAANKLEKEKKAKADLMKAARAAARKKVADAKRKAEGKPVKKAAKKKVGASRGSGSKVAGGRKTGATKKRIAKKAVKKKVVKKATKKIAKKVVRKTSLASKLKKKISGN